jgi:hypothetical protein
VRWLTVSVSALTRAPVSTPTQVVPLTMQAGSTPREGRSTVGIVDGRIPPSSRPDTFSRSPRASRVTGADCAPFDPLPPLALAPAPLVACRSRVPGCWSRAEAEHGSATARRRVWTEMRNWRRRSEVAPALARPWLRGDLQVIVR